MYVYVRSRFRHGSQSAAHPSSPTPTNQSPVGLAHAWRAGGATMRNWSGRRRLSGESLPACSRRTATWRRPCAGRMRRSVRYRSRWTRCGKSSTIRARCVWRAAPRTFTISRYQGLQQAPAANAIASSSLQQMAVASCCQQSHSPSSDSLLPSSWLFTNFITKRPRQEAKLTEPQKGYVRFTTKALYVSECGYEGAPAAPAAAGGSGQRQAVSGRWSVATRPHPCQPSGAQHLSNSSLCSLEWRHDAMATFSNFLGEICSALRNVG